MFCCTLLYVHSSFAIILMGKRELVALLTLSSLCLVIVIWLFLAVPWVCLQFVIVVFPDHTHLLCSNLKMCFMLIQKKTFIEQSSRYGYKIIIDATFMFYGTKFHRVAWALLPFSIVFYFDRQ